MRRTRSIVLMVAILMVSLIPSEALAAEGQIKNLRQRHVACGGNRCLKVTADLVAGPDLVGPVDCYQGRKFKLQRRQRRNGRNVWKTVAEGTTQQDLDIVVKAIDRRGRYRILIPASTSDSTQIDCYKVVKEFVHRH